MYDVSLPPIKFLLPEEKPREKLEREGAETLSDSELLAIILGSGTKQTPIEVLANSIFLKWRGERAQGKNLTLKELLSINGMGRAKSAQVLASLELGKRWSQNLSKPIRSPEDLYPYIHSLFDQQSESVISISLNAANQIIHSRRIFKGTINRTIFHPREVLCDIISDRASSFLLSHNHPSGNLLPSSEDCKITHRIFLAAEIIGIPFLDHIIYSEHGYFSFRKEGMLEKEEEKKVVHLNG